MCHRIIFHFVCDFYCSVSTPIHMFTVEWLVLLFVPEIIFSCLKCPNQFMLVSWCLHSGKMSVFFIFLFPFSLEFRATMRAKDKRNRRRCAELYAAHRCLVYTEPKVTSVKLHDDVRTNDFNEFPQVTCSHTKHITWDCAATVPTDTNQQQRQWHVAIVIAIQQQPTNNKHLTQKKKKRIDNFTEYIHFYIVFVSSQHQRESYDHRICTPYERRHVRGQRYLLFMLMDMDELDIPRDSTFHLDPFAVGSERTYVIIKLPNGNATNVNDMLINTHRSSTNLSLCVSLFR